jgi:hypothetical protein
VTVQRVVFHYSVELEGLNTMAHSVDTHRAGLGRLTFRNPKTLIAAKVLLYRYDGGEYRHSGKGGRRL